MDSLRSRNNYFVQTEKESLVHYYCCSRSAVYKIMHSLTTVTADDVNTVKTEMILPHRLHYFQQRQTYSRVQLPLGADKCLPTESY